MLEESEMRPKSGCDPSMNRHRPASEKSQDISHVLTSIFKDLYTHEVIGKDTFSNLTKTKRGQNDYHDKYVEELQQVHTEYMQRMKEADMLESHIIQARVGATATESQARERMLEEVGDVYDQLGLPPVKPTFEWCVDNDLLKRNNLICPQDYLTRYSPLKKAPAVKPNRDYTKPTFTYNMHVSREPQDDGYTLIPSAGKSTDSLQEESECNLTLESSSEANTKNKPPTEKPTQVHPRPKWTKGITLKSRAEETDTLRKPKERRSFLRNPRFLPPMAQHGGKSLIRPRSNVEKMAQGNKRALKQSPTDEPVPIFLANPSVVFFTGYSVGQVYETAVELKNLTASSRHVRVLPPTTPYFSVGLGRFPGEGGIVAPGMSCKYAVRFAPDSLADYEDFIEVETQAQYPLLVPVVARRPPPILTLPRVLDCGCCLMGGVKFVEFLCRNDGLSAGTFCIIPKSQWPASNLRCVVMTSFAEQPPFAVSPSLFQLQPGQATVLEVVFFPTTVETCSQVFTIVCDNCQVKDITIEGESQQISLELVSVSGEKACLAVGEMHDLTAEHFVRFSSCNPYSLQRKKLVIRNNAHLELPFHWQIMKPNLQPLLPGEAPDPSHIQFHLATDDVFRVSPLTGVLAPCQDHEFLLTYFPQELKDYHSVCHLVMRDIPQLTESSENGAPQPLSMASKVTDVIVMEIEVKGSTEPYQVLLEPYAIHFPGELFIGTTTRRKFKMWNHSKSCVLFRWERMSNCHIIEVEPPTGELEVNECFDLDLVVTGGRPERVVTSLLCHIEHHHKPVPLAVEVAFKGPIVTVNVPSLDLGLVRLGEQAQTTALLTNTTQLEASWTLEERNNSQQDDHQPQILLQPCRGLLAPLASCSVDVLFRSRSCQHFETVLELAVENGTGCHLSVQADVQSPLVCLLCCELVFSDLYLGIPAKGTVCLFNQTLLPAHFTWTQSQLQGKQASLCSASFDPSSGTLGPNANMEITVSFTSHTELELTEVAALCEVQGMKSPLVLGFYSKAKKLSVSYSLPSNRAASDDQDPSPLLVDFGDDVLLKRAVSKQLVITNHTAIPAPFTIEAEYFTGHALSTPQPNDQSQKRFTYMKKPLHSVQAKKVEEKAHKEFVSSLLAHGKGAAFFVLPDAGMLGPFGTQTIDITAYTDMWGEYRDHLICRVGDLEPRLIPIQMTVTGCPLYFQMIGPRPDDQNQGPIIQFGTHVSGGDTVSRSLRINNPSPYDIRMDWETYNIDQNDKKLLDVVVAYGEAFPLKDADGNEVIGGASALCDENVQPTWNGSHTPSSEGTSSSLLSKSDIEDEEYMTEEDHVEEEDSVYPWPPKKKLFSVYIRPHMGNLSDYPYCVTPQQIVIPSKGSGTIHVSFTPLTLSGPTSESRCVGLALGFMSLDSKTAACIPGKVGRAQGLNLEPVRIDLRAVVKPAWLLVQMEEDGGVLEFHASAGDLLKGDSESELLVQEFDITQTVHLKNTLEVPLHFRLGAQPPFYVLQPQPQPRAQTSRSSNPPTSDGQPLVLQPQHNCQVKVAFHCSLPLLDHANLDKEEVSPAVTLVHSAGGQRKLRFRQNLLVRYSNNSLQTVPLCAHLDLPTPCLSSDSIDFGTCYVGQTQVIEVNLSSQGACSYWSTVTDSDEEDVHVFRVTPDSGVLRPLEPPHTRCRQPLKIHFTASEDRVFRAVVIVQGVLVKPPLTLHVQGRGSFDERFRA